MLLLRVCLLLDGFRLRQTLGADALGLLLHGVSLCVGLGLRRASACCMASYFWASASFCRRISSASA